MSDWERLPGSNFERISVASADRVWALGPIYVKIYQPEASNPWKNGPHGTISDLSVSNDGLVYAIINVGTKIKDQIVNVSLQAGPWTFWKGAGGRAVQISVGRNHDIWAVNRARNVYRREGGRWRHFPTVQLKQVSAAFDGTVYGITPDNKIKQYLGHDNWATVPGTMRQIGVGSRQYVWAVDTRSRIYYYKGDGEWQHVPGYLDWVSVGQDGAVWGIRRGNIYRYKLPAVPIQFGTVAYTDSNFGGDPIEVAPGDHDKDALSALLGGGTLGSLRVPEGLEVAIFKSADLIGDHQVLQAGDHADVASLLPRIDGLQVRNVDYPKELPVKATVYTEPDYWGQRMEVDPGEYNIHAVKQLIGNDKISSVKVPPGQEMSLFEHHKFKGRRVKYTGNVADLGTDMDNRASSIKLV